MLHKPAKHGNNNIAVLKWSWFAGSQFIDVRNAYRRLVERHILPRPMSAYVMGAFGFSSMLGSELGSGLNVIVALSE